MPVPDRRTALPREDDLAPALLPLIDRALADRLVAAPIPHVLWPRYFQRQLAARRPHNRLVVVVLMALFDLFWVVQWRSAPELLVLSAVLRLAVATPLALLFLAVDRRGWWGGAYDAALMSLCVTCAAITAYLCLRTQSVNTLADIRASPMILLTSCVALRLSPRAVIANATLCAALFIGSVWASPIVPRTELGGLIFTEIGNAAVAWAVSLILERRDRAMFLLTASDQIRRAELASQNQGLLQETQTDALTGCANRRCFDETLAAVWDEAVRGGSPVGLIMIDIDHFKLFNDHYGHQGGDACLARVAAAARGQVRSTDLIARYGGEEFAIIMANAPPKVVVAAAGRVRAAVAALALPHAGVGTSAHVSVSVGAASMAARDPHGARLLVETADRYLYGAKRTGRNRVVYWEEPPLARVI